ncbi:diacylglycerol kinase family protein [Microbacterium sp. 179-B 1A2 NHS]|uniref:diacylglycerol kinase family protein n=1 Tax=Microbacterium sp. 179-B 1A2 NHS TaxID=3142383 RepID=UPI0039A0BF79
MRVALLVNPTARAGSGSGTATRVADLLRADGVEVRVVTPPDADATGAALDEFVAERPDGILVAGGDGTVGIALARVRGTGIPLGIVATGTGNDLALALGLPSLDADAAAAAVTSGTVRALDLARSIGPDGAERLYATVFASGFDSRVNDRANRMRWPRGRTRYTIAVLREFLALRTTPYVLDLERPDGTTTRISEDLLIAAVGNGPSYGGGIPVCPDARMDDGLLDVTVVRPAGRIALLRLLRRVYAGTHTDAPQVSTYRVSAITLVSPGGTGYADGEPLGALPVRIDVLPAAVRVFAPV